MTGRMAEPPAFRPRRGWYSVPLRRPAAVTVFLSCLIGWVSVGQADDPVLGDVEKAIEIRIPLYGGTHYRPRDVARQYRDRFDTPLQIEDVSDEPRRLSAGEWAALQVAHLAGLIVVERREDELLLRFPRKPEVGDGRATSWLEALGVPVPDPWDGLGLAPAIADIDPKTRTVLLIHGMGSSTEAMGQFRTAFEQSSVQVLAFDYPRRCSIAVAGDRLSSELSALAQHHPKLRFTIVAHSMGGLVARYLLEDPTRNPGCVTGVVFLGTPHEGSELARFHISSDALRALLPRPRWWIVDQSGFTGARDLVPGSKALTAMNRRSRPEGVRYYVAAGTRGLWTEAQAADLVDEAQRIMDARRFPPEHRERLLRVLNSDELCSGRGDGAVSVRSAALPAAKTVRHFELNHLELLLRGGATRASAGEELLAWILAIVQENGGDGTGHPRR